MRDRVVPTAEQVADGAPRLGVADVLDAMHLDAVHADAGLRFELCDGRLQLASGVDDE